MAIYDLTKRLTLMPHMRAIYKSAHGFRKTKRAQVRDLQRAMEPLNMGSAYLSPEAYTLTCSIRDDIARLRELVSVKEWKR